jgi:hypothetical protein
MSTKGNFEKGAGIGAGMFGAAVSLYLTFGFIVGVGMAVALMLVNFGDMLAVTWPVRVGIGLAITGLMLTVLSRHQESIKSHLKVLAVTLFLPLLRITSVSSGLPPDGIARPPSGGYLRPLADISYSWHGSAGSSPTGLAALRGLRNLARSPWPPSM